MIESVKNMMKKSCQFQQKISFLQIVLLTLLGGSLRIKAQGLTRDKTIDKPFFDSSKNL